jgi:hypothetical protein
VAILDAHALDERGLFVDGQVERLGEELGQLRVLRCRRHSSLVGRANIAELAR